MLIHEGDQKIEHFFLPLGQCHCTLLECENIVGEVKANSQAPFEMFAMSHIPLLSLSVL
jgi:hypothetical protein